MNQEGIQQNSADADLTEDLFAQGETPPERSDPQADAEAMGVSLTRAIYHGKECVEIYAHGEDPVGGTQEIPRTVLLARVTERELTMFPLVSASYRREFLSPKYEELTTITIVADEHEPFGLPETIPEFDGMLESLPVGFGRHAKYGLGFKWEYRLIPEAILELVGVTELVVEPGNGASVEMPKFRLGIERFSTIRRSIDTIIRRANARSMRDRRILAYNETLHTALPEQFERRYPKSQPGEIYELIQLRGRNPSRSTKDSLAAAEVVRDDAQKIAAEHPSQLLELRAVIEQVTLKELISKFEAMLAKNLPEPKWQAFFKANPFILSLAFPYPVLLLQDQAHIGGTTMRGSGESIVDFLLTQRFTGNLALIEIKRPSSSLIESKPYRGDLHAPHRDLVGAMAQVLDQRSQLLHHFAVRKSQDSALEGAHVSSVHCIVIAGTMPAGADETRSLDLFRNSSKDVAVVTFDELLEKLRELHRLMSSGESGTTSPDDDIPF